MYEAFYGLSERPFNLTPDPRFLYLSDKHKEAFAHLLYGIKNRTGFVMVSGEIGTGKTTICRTLLSRLDDDTEVAFIFNPILSPDELLSKINEDFGIPTRATTTKGLIDELNAYLLEQYRVGKQCVLVIDEAQDLEPRVLEQIRLLSNLETETQKLLQIVLIGQPELIDNLALPELRQLNQRITARYHLKALDRHETLQYIAYRIRVAGGRRKIRFTPSAVKAVFRASQGTPRVINAICDRALLIGYTKESRDITTPIVKRAVREIRGEKSRKRKRAPIRAFLPSRKVLVTALLLVVFGIFAAPPLTDGIRTLIETAPWESIVTGAASNPGPEHIEPVVAEEPAEPPEEPATTIASAPADGEEEEPLSPLVRLIDRRDPEVARIAAALGILRAWNLPDTNEYPEADTADSLKAFAETHGFNVQVLPMTFDQVAALNLPAFVRVMGNEQVAWLGVLEVNDIDVRLASGLDETQQVPRDEIARRSLNQAVIPWRDPNPNANLLRERDRGDRVRELQTLLQSIGMYEGEVDGVFDEATAEAIKSLQRRVGFNDDGIVGEKTRMILSGLDPANGAPSLVEAATVPEEEAAEDMPFVGPPAPEPEPVEEPDEAEDPESIEDVESDPVDASDVAQEGEPEPSAEPDPEPTEEPAETTETDPEPVDVDEPESVEEPAGRVEEEDAPEASDVTESAEVEDSEPEESESESPSEEADTEEAESSESATDVVKPSESEEPVEESEAEQDEELQASVAPAEELRTGPPAGVTPFLGHFLENGGNLSTEIDPDDLNLETMPRFQTEDTPPETGQNDLIWGGNSASGFGAFDEGPETTAPVDPRRAPLTPRSDSSEAEETETP